jgi:ABC-2 type transport system permease protein
VREAVVFAILLLWMAPRLLALSGVSMEWLHSAGAALGGLAWPWSAGARAAFPERPVPLWLAFASLCCWTGAAAWFGRAQFERSLRYDTAAAQATPSAATPAHALVDRFYRFPGLIWRDPLAAIVEKELRTLARSPRFRVVFLMGFTFGLAVWLPLALGDRGGELSRYFFPVVCLYAMILMGQVSYWNCFGLDRSAAQIYFIAPGPFRTALAGKNIASLVYIYLEVAIVSAVTAALRLVTGWGQLAETAAAVGVGALYLMAIGNLSSVRYPRPLNPDRASQGGSSGRVQALVFLLFPLALAPVVLAYLARYAFDSQAVFDVFLAIAGAGGVALYRASLQSAASAATERRETLIQQLSRGEGPVASA